MNAGAPGVLVTGASGYIGRKLIAALAGGAAGTATGEPPAASPVRSSDTETGGVVALDLRPPPEAERLPGVTYLEGDIRDREGLEAAMSGHPITTVVHLVSVVAPERKETRNLAYQVDVVGTRNVLDACLASGVEHLIVTSSGAAYGYHGDNPEWLDETDPLRGNEEFAYAHHKRLVEEMLARARVEHPRLKQLVFRPGTILGEGVRNHITALFERRWILGIAGSASPFVFIWDEDVVACIMKGIRERSTGIFNLAGDGVVPLREIARRVGRPYLPLPAWLVAGALGVLHPLGLSPYHPGQVNFLRYRPVLSNRRLKEEFGYTPRLTSSQVFDLYRRSRR